MEKKEEILRVRNLDISFETTAGVVNAVRIPQRLQPSRPGLPSG